MTLQLGILLALLCAFATNLAFLYKHRGACAAPQVDIATRCRARPALFRSKWFAIGMVVGARRLDLPRRRAGPRAAVDGPGRPRRRRRDDRRHGRPHLRLPASAAASGAASACTAAGLVLLASRCRAPAARTRFSVAAMIAFEGGLLGVGGLLDPRPARSARPTSTTASRSPPPPASSSASATSPSRRSPGWSATTAHRRCSRPWLLVALVASVAAFYASARSLQDGEAVPVIALTGDRGQRLRHRRRHPRLRRPDARRHARHRRCQALAFLLVIVASALTPGPRSAPAAPQRPPPPSASAAALRRCDEPRRRHGRR